jgi:formiminotetrahydrofolate cyclodeaminase
MASSAMAAAASVQVASSSQESRIGLGVAAAVLAAGGLGGVGGYLLARWAGQREISRLKAALAEEKGADAAVGGCDAAIERALSAIDSYHVEMAKMRDSADDSGDRAELQMWAGKLAGEPMTASLRLALRAQCFSRDGKSGAISAVSLGALLRREQLDEDVVVRTCQLVAKDELLTSHPEMNVVEDAVCLASFSRCPVSDSTDCVEAVENFRNMWTRMSRRAQGIALTFDYTPKSLGCLLEAMASAEGLAVTELPMVAPRLPAATLKILRESWAKIPKDAFGEEFLIRLLNENADLHSSVNKTVARPKLIVQFVQLLLDLLDPESVPRLERVTHAAAALSRHFGSFRMQHMGALKRALTRTIVMYMPAKDKRKISRAWEAFFYALAAVAAPHLALSASVSEFLAAAASPFPFATHGALMAAQGIALLEMCLGMTAAQTSLSKNEGLPSEVVLKLGEARSWLVESIRSEVNAFCGLLASSYGRVQDACASIDVEENERRLWQRRATEVPLKVADYSIGVASTCLTYRKRIVRSLENDWLAAAHFLQAATETAMKYTRTNLSYMGKDQRGDIEAQLARLQNELEANRSVWQELSDV